jgi:hypothetical protein
MNNNWMLFALLLGGLFFLRRSPAQQPSDLGVSGYTGGAGTGYGIDIWGDEG